MDPQLRFADHITTIVQKGHQRANLIHRCFTSRDRSLLVKAFITYVRPILEYNSPVWSPTSKKEISRIEAVQRRFTKRISGMFGLPYYARLKSLNLESLEMRRIRTDLLTVYKLLFGLLNTNSEVFFTLRAHAHLRGHPYALEKQRCTSSIRQSFFCNRIVNIWNNLPRDTTDFSSFQRFRRSLSRDYLAQSCKVNIN